MIAIPAGTFYDGYAYMTISTAFSMSEYPITQSQYEAVMGSNPSASGSGNNYPVDSANWYQAIVFCNTLSIAEGLTPVYSINGSTNPSAWGTIPVSGGGANMSWDSVTMAKGASGYRLPTSSEWMWAAMGGLQDGLTSDVVINPTYGKVNESGYLKGYAGSTEVNGGTSNIGNYCWYSANSGGRTQPVGGKLPNEFGLYDMCGNVGEYTFDYYWGEEQGASNGNPVAISFPSTDETDYSGLPAGTGVWRWILGGSFTDSTGYMAILPQGTYVEALNPSIAKDYVGFRVVKGGAY
jgi:formylglycine-generating enzyme required for sulfatase activity